jgi:hypothetical protein
MTVSELITKLRVFDQDALIVGEIDRVWVFQLSDETTYRIGDCPAGRKPTENPKD